MVCPEGWQQEMASSPTHVTVKFEQGNDYRISNCIYLNQYEHNEYREPCLL